MTQNRPTDEELMALADGELPPAEAARLSALVAADPVLASKVDMYRQTGSLVREARDVIGADPVPDALRHSIEAMIAAQAKPQADETVVPFRPRPAVPSTSRRMPWAMPVAASLIAVLGGLAGYVIGKSADGGNAGAIAAVGGTLPAQIGTMLASNPSGTETALADGRMRVIATMQSKTGSLCREFEIDKASGQAVVGIACRDGTAWRLDIAVAAPQTGEGFAPASSLNAIDSYLDMIEAGEPLTPEQEAAVLLDTTK